MCLVRHFLSVEVDTQVYERIKSERENKKKKKIDFTREGI